MPSPMVEPFVFPIGRDFAPKEYLCKKYGFNPLDEVSLDEVLENGIERSIFFYTTHTIVESETIRNDMVRLKNPRFGINMLCELEVSETPLHFSIEEDFYKIPEKLWHQFRNHLFIGRTPESVSEVWAYNTTKLRMLKLQLNLSISPEKFENIQSIFNNYHMNTLPLHLFHYWSYIVTEHNTVDTPDGKVSFVEEKGVRRVVNKWKDFLIVRREANPNKVVIGIASDFHYAEKNDKIHEINPESKDVNTHIRRFSRKAYRMWKNGKLDYIVLNGDFIDHSWKWDWAWAPQVRYPTYEESNWNGFERAIRKLLFQVPTIWNPGDHDRLRNPYPLFPSGVENSHYNYYGLTETIENMSYFMSPTGMGASHFSELRWIFEKSRINSWPLIMSLKIGEKKYNLICLDTGYMNGGFLIHEYPINPLLCSGIKDLLISAVLNAGDFNIIITHAPPICLPPTDVHLIEGGEFNASEADYGVFEQSRQALLQVLSTQVEEHKPVIVVSGHVHFKSAYAFENRYNITTGPFLWSQIERLADLPTLDLLHIEPEVFWGRFPCLMLTNPPIGPKPTRKNQKAAFLILKLGSDGISKIAWEGIY